MNILAFLMLFLYLGGNAYVYIRSMHYLQQAPVAVKIIFSTLFWLCVVGIAGAHFLRNTRLPVGVLSVVYEISTSWLVFTLYMVLFLVVFDLLKLFNLALPHPVLFALGFTLCLLTYGYYRFKRPVVQQVNITINKPLTDGRTSLRVVGISDLHLGFRTTKAQLRTYVELINAQKPDLIVISGDLIDNGIEPVRRQHLGQELLLLQAPLGIYMVPGNHEYLSGIAASRDYITQNTTICLLQDTVVNLANGLQLIGRDDRFNTQRKTLGQLMQGADPQRPSVALDHQPYHLHNAVEAGVDLLLCGHTHRGQVWPMSWLTDHLFDISYGYEKRQSTHIYVSSGLALWGAPFRIGTNSELVVFNLTFQTP